MAGQEILAAYGVGTYVRVVLEGSLVQGDHTSPEVAHIACLGSLEVGNPGARHMDRNADSEEEGSHRMEMVTVEGIVVVDRALEEGRVAAEMTNSEVVNVVGVAMHLGEGLLVERSTSCSQR